MRIGILVSSIGNYGKSGFYNLQEVGLAKALANQPKIEQILVYRLVAVGESAQTQYLGNQNKVVFTTLPAKNIGANGLVDTKLLKKNIDVLIYFSDNQFSVPTVYRWAKANHIRFYPYIGVLESHSTSTLKKSIMNSLLLRNLHIYRKCHCLVKTPEIESQLKSTGVHQVSVLPVGLDFSLLKTDYAQTSVTKLRKKYGFSSEDSVILFVGRLTAEKRPLEMLELFAHLQKKHPQYKLLMIGKGELSEAVRNKIHTHHLEQAVMLLDQHPNTEMWEIYRLADIFINLNSQEIFGMAILEAMYYECKVIAIQAPGPSSILENGKTGYLVQTLEQIEPLVLNSPSVSEMAHNAVIQHFTWDCTAERLFPLLFDTL